MGNIDNIGVKGAEFQFAGKVRKMVFINKAVRFLKEKHGGFQKSIKMIDDSQGEIDLDILADILFAGFMVNHDEALTIDVIKAALDEMTFYQTRELATTHLVAAITGTYPEAKADDEKGSSDPQ
jgi:hypothetical protein